MKNKVGWKTFGVSLYGLVQNLRFHTVNSRQIRIQNHALPTDLMNQRRNLLQSKLVSVFGFGSQGQSQTGSGSLGEIVANHNCGKGLEQVMSDESRRQKAGVRSQETEDRQQEAGSRRQGAEGEN